MHGIALLAAIQITAGASALPPTQILPAPGAGGVSIAGGVDRGWILPFDGVERDQVGAELTAHWSPAEVATFRLGYEWLSASWPDGTSAAGSGDIRLGGAGRLWPLPARTARPSRAAHPAIPELWVDWQVKLPNAADTGAAATAADGGGALVYGLGSDETDVLAGGALRWALAPVVITAGGWLAILGNPEQFANQDDAAVMALRVEVPAGAALPYGRVEARLASPRNPADVSAALGAGWRLGRSLQVGAEGRVGATPAAADWGASGWVGYSWPCPYCQED